jgi:hypothetical protein
MLTQGDLMGLKSFPDGIAIGGWPMDDHAKMDFDHSDIPPYRSIKVPIYNIPLRSLCSKDVSNLMMAGRNASCSHVAFTSTRVMGTCAVMGQAAGTVAALAARDKVDPRAFHLEPPRLRAPQQQLLRDDQTIVGVVNEDPDDLARSAQVTASAELVTAPAHAILDGMTRDIPDASLHRWSTPLGPDGAWIELRWPDPKPLDRVQITFDTGFERELTLTAQDSVQKGIIRAPQPETVKNYSIQIQTTEGGDWKTVASVADNHQRLVRHSFDPTTALAVRLTITATHGDDLARVFEIRCYGDAPPTIQARG